MFALMLFFALANEKFIFCCMILMSNILSFLRVQRRYVALFLGFH